VLCWIADIGAYLAVIVTGQSHIFGYAHMGISARYVVRHNDFAPPPGVIAPANARRISGALLTAETCHAN